MKKRYTPEYITYLRPNEVFVFGSNIQGLHRSGAAKCAYENFGAVKGLGVGFAGQSYAIPTMQGGIETIKPYVDQFIEFAQSRKDLTFLVTPIGCGIAGFKPEQIALLFEKALDLPNVVMPEVFVYWITRKQRYESEMSGIQFKTQKIKFYPEDLKAMESMTHDEKMAYCTKLRQENRYIIVEDDDSDI